MSHDQFNANVERVVSEGFAEHMRAGFVAGHMGRGVSAFEWFGQVLDGETPVGGPFPIHYARAAVTDGWQDHFGGRVEFIHGDEPGSAWDRTEWDRSHRIASDASEKE